jgi:apolipoprotein N-acyltransferase
MSDSTPTTETESLTPPAPEPAFAAGPTVPFEPAERSASTEPMADAATLRPRTRWAAIIWGAVFAVAAALALWIAVSPDRRTALADWSLSLSPAAIGAYILLAIGAIALVAGLVGIVRRLQRAVEARRSGLPSD